MDKIAFVDKAPSYYAFAIVTALKEARGSPKTISDLDEIIESSQYRYLKKAPVLDEALRILSTSDGLEVIRDDFGPTLYQMRGDFNAWVTVLAVKYPVFEKFGVVSKPWLRSALRSVNDSFDELKLTPDDFEARDSVWEPIPLNRSDDTLVAATAAVDAAIDAAESDNGYAVHAPGEREYVVSSLKSFSDILKNKAQVTALQIKTFAIEPLTRLIRRFGPAALGVTADAAKQAIFEWLKANFAKAISWLF